MIEKRGRSMGKSRSEREHESGIILMARIKYREGEGGEGEEELEQRINKGILWKFEVRGE